VHWLPSQPDFRDPRQDPALLGLSLLSGLLLCLPPNRADVRLSAVPRPGSEWPAVQAQGTGQGEEEAAAAAGGQRIHSQLSLCHAVSGRWSIPWVSIY